MAARARPADLRDACLQEAFRIVSEQGVEGLSLREVARRLGVSHQAPYRHFASRDHLLAGIVERTFAEFSEALERRPQTGDPHADLRAMADAYLDYARDEPLKYRLMFATALPPPERHPGMMAQARAAFSLLRRGLERLGRAPGNEVELDALFIWSALHGLASIAQSHAADTLNLTAGVRDRARSHILAALDRALGN